MQKVIEFIDTFYSFSEFEEEMKMIFDSEFYSSGSSRPCKCITQFYKYTYRTDCLIKRLFFSQGLKKINAMPL